MLRRAQISLSTQTDSSRGGSGVLDEDRGTEEVGRIDLAHRAGDRLDESILTWHMLATLWPYCSKGAPSACC